MERRALLSVYDKTGVAKLAGFLAEQGYSLLSTGGTFRVLSDAGVAVTEVSAYTGADEILDGRVKTLHPKIHGGLLGRRENDAHRRAMAEGGIDPIDVVVVNLYPFFEKSGEGLPLEELVEFIDIGGPTMIRAAAKNHRYVTVITDPRDYVPVMEEWKTQGAVGEVTRRRLAAKVFALTGAYDSAVAAGLADDDAEAPEWLSFSYKKAAELRYGENPHQDAAWYVPSSASAFGALSDFVQHQGKELSFNNLRDLDSAWRAVNEFDSPACVGVKHAAPCGVALASSPAEAWIKAKDADSLSIFGGIVAFNRKMDEDAAVLLSEIFLEVIAAPEYADAALEVFGKKKNLRVLTLARVPSDRWEALPVDGGFCLQTVDSEFLPAADWVCPTKIKPTAEQYLDLEFAWRVAKHVKSNGIVLAAGGVTLGIGTGQPNRIGAVNLAVSAAGDKSRGAVMASDAFFPFDDAVKAAARAGITAIAQPGGSVRDADSITACDEAGIAMTFPGRRHFRH